MKKGTLENELDLEFGIYNKQTRTGEKKWVFKVPHVTLFTFLGLKGTEASQLANLHRARIHVHYWTARSNLNNNRLMFCFMLSESEDRPKGAPARSKRLKLTTKGNGFFGICNPTLRHPDTGVVIPVPEKYAPGKPRTVHATAADNGSEPIYSFDVPEGWGVELLSRRGRPSKPKIATAPAKAAVVSAIHRDAVDARDNLNAALADDQNLIVCVKDSDGKIVGEGRSVSLRVVEVLTTISTRDL